MTPSEFTHQVIDDSSRVVSGALVHFRQGSRPGPVFIDPELRTPARNPYITRADGMCHVFLNAGDTYEITIETPKRRWQFTHVAKGKEIVREPSVTVSEDTQHGAAPFDPPLPAAPDPIVIEKTVEVEKIVHVENPETQERLAEALRKLDEANAALETRKSGPEDEPENEVPVEAVRSVLSEVGLSPTDNYERINEILLPKFLHAKQCHYLALGAKDGQYDGASSVEWERKAERYDSGLKWNRGRSAETL